MFHVEQSARKTGRRLNSKAHRHQVTPRPSRASRDCGVSRYHSFPLKRDGTAGGAPPINPNAQNFTGKARGNWIFGAWYLFGICHLRACCPNPARHREEPKGRRGDLLISITYGRLLRRFASRNDRKPFGNSPLRVGFSPRCFRGTPDF